MSIRRGTSTMCFGGLMLALVLCTAPGFAQPTGTLAEDEGGVGVAGTVPPTQGRGTADTFTDEATFLSAAGAACTTGLLSESFEGLGATNASDQPSLVLTDFTITEAEGPNMGVWNVPAFGGFATDGTQWVGFSYRDDAMTPDFKILTFNAPITMFGINITDFGDFGAGNLDYSDDAGNLFPAAVSGGADGNLQFFGIIDGEINVVTFIDPISGEFFGIDEVYYCPAPPPEADLGIIKTGTIAGSTVTYEIQVTNNGPGDATNTVVVDALPPEVTYVSDDCGGMNAPPWTWNVGTLTPGAMAVCTITVTVNDGVAGPITNTASVTSDVTDPVSSNDDATAVVQAGTVLDIPALGPMGLVALLLSLALVGAWVLRRRHAA